MMREHFDAWSLIVIVITFLLFGAALFTTGFTHNLLLESGVFLVSLKLIQMSYKNSISTKLIRKELREIRVLLQQSQK